MHFVKEVRVPLLILKSCENAAKKGLFLQLHTNDCRIGSSRRILMLFGPVSTNLRSRNTNLVRKMREIFCVHCKLVLKTGNFGCFCTFSSPYFRQFEWKSSCFLIRFVFLDLKLVDIAPKSIKIGAEMAFLEVSVKHTLQTMFFNLYLQLL